DGEVAVGVAGDLELAVLLAVAIRGRAGREILGVRGDERTFHFRIAALDLRVRRSDPGRTRHVVNVVLELDAIQARLEDEGLRDVDAIAIGPGEQHTQLGGAGGERVFLLSARVLGYVIRARRAVRPGEAGL